MNQDHQIFRTTMTLFAIADRGQSHQYDASHYLPGGGGPHPSVRRPSSCSDNSWQGSIGSSGPEFSPHTSSSTARTSPTITPEGTGKAANWTWLLPPLPKAVPGIESLWGDLDRHARSRLGPARARRPSVRQTPYGPYAPGLRGRGREHYRHPGRDTGSISSASSSNAEDVGGRDKKPHFNQPYTKSVKLFILYYKDDCKYGWPAINARRLELLPVLLGESYKREVEENRKVAGINGFYYRLNAMMPALTPDGSGLLFMEKDGRYWEYTESSKCRTSSSSSLPPSTTSTTSTTAAAAAPTTTTKTTPEEFTTPSTASPVPTRSDARPRGMVDRYPEEVVHYWEKYVRHFVPPEKHAEVYAKAKRYSEIRADQRREKGVPQWTPDNEAERVIHKNPPDGKSKASRKEITQTHP